MFGECETAACAGDRQTTAKVQAKLDESPALKADTLYVQTVNGVVYLNGLVDTHLELRQAGDMVLTVPGVTQVVNKLGVRGNVW